MKKLVSLLLVLCLVLPNLAEAAGKSKRGLDAQDTLTYEEKATFEGKANVRLGSELIFVSQDLSQASFKKDSVCSVKHALHYFCPCKKIFKRRPGLCPCGKSLMPGFKHGQEWYILQRDDAGKLNVLPVTSRQCCGGTTADCAACEKCSGTSCACGSKCLSDKSCCTPDGSCVKAPVKKSGCSSCPKAKKCPKSTCGK